MPYPPLYFDNLANSHDVLSVSSWALALDQYEMVINTRHWVFSLEKVLTRNTKMSRYNKMIFFLYRWLVQFELSRSRRQNVLSKIQWKSISRRLFEDKWTFWTHKYVVHYRFFFIIIFQFILSQKCQCDPVWLRFWILTLPHIQPFGSFCLRKEWLVIIWLKCSIY